MFEMEKEKIPLGQECKNYIVNENKINM